MMLRMRRTLVRMWRTLEEVDIEEDVPGSVSEQHYKPSKLPDGDRFSSC